MLRFSLAKFLTFWLLVAIARLAAADFDLAQPTIEMRRLQLCEQCREPLVVTTIAEGAVVCCPKCQHVQRRLPNRELLVKIYQVCPSCSARLDVANLPPETPVRCGACGFAQRVMAEATMPPSSGTGEIPAGNSIAPTSPLPQKSASAALPSPRVPGLNPDPLADTSEAEDTETENSRETFVSANSAPEFARNSLSAADGAFAEPSLAQLAASLQISARVNGEPVSTAAVNQTVMRNLQLLQMRRGAPPTAAELTELRQEIIAQLIEREILRQAALNAGYVPDAGEVQKRLQLAPGSQTRSGVIAEMTREEMKKRHRGKAALITERDVENYFKAHRTEFAQPWRAKIRAITVYRERQNRPDQRGAEQIAKEIKERLDFGIGFAAVANRYSEDVFHNDGGLMRGTGGEIIAFNELADELARAITPPSAGKIYGPIEMPTCVAFCQLDEVFAPPPPELNNFKPQIREILQQLARDAAFELWLAELKKNAVIEYQ